MTHGNPARILLVGALALPTAPALPQAASEVFVDIAPCMNQPDDRSRHACYDRLEAAVRTARQQGEHVADSSETTLPAPLLPAPAPAPAVPEPETPESPSTVAEFGNHTPTTQARIERNETGEAELHDRIVGMRQREPNRWLFTLASGQVWYQANSQRIRLREGMAVRIYPSPLGGSWRMSGTDDSTGFVQVRRVE